MKKFFGALLAVGFTSVVTHRAAAGTLDVSVALIPAGTAVNLTEQGTDDWIHWGLLTDTSLNRKANVAPLISDYSPVAPPDGYVYTFRYADNFNGYTWTDGIPAANVNNSPTGVWAYGFPAEGTGFRLSVPASTNPQTLKVYVGAYAARGTFVAYLSEANTAGYTNSTAIENIGNGPSGVFTVTFAASSANQTLHVFYTLNRLRGGGGDGNVTLQAAALSSAGNNLPFVALTSPPDRASFDSTDMLLTANAGDSDGTIALVEFYDGANKIGEADESPYFVTWFNPPPGIHLLSARAVDNGGGVSVSASNLVYVNGVGGLLSGGRADAPASVNLTTEGTADWTHWGSVAVSSFDHKAEGGSQIANFTLIGTNVPQRHTDNPTSFSWSDGTPLASVFGSTTGIEVQGINNGFEIQAPADRHRRTLKVYAGLYGSQANFEAFLTDFSGAFTDITLSSTFGTRFVVYSIDYAAASAGQRLIVRQTIRKPLDAIYGNVSLQAATLQQAPNTAPVISITIPLANSVLIAPAAFNVSASASDADGSVTNVEFLLGADSVGMITSAPYEVMLVDVAAGQYVLSAIATDNDGARSTNQIAFTVNERPSISITNPVEGAIFTAPAAFTIGAAAFDADGFVTSVEFLLGVNSVGTIMSAPYEVTLADIPSGQHVLSAIATDNQGAKSTNQIAVTVNERPSVSITNPADGGIFIAPAGFTVGAAASDADGFVTSVEFLLGANSVGTIMSAPYEVTLANVSGGPHVLSAIASDNHGAKNTNRIAITVNERPSVSITNPAEGAVFTAPAGFTVGAAASDADGFVTSVEFLLGANSVGTIMRAPYEVTLANIPGGKHVLSAIATDNRGAKNTNRIAITVNEGPSISITNPAEGAVFTAPAGFTVGAAASDADGFVTSVEFLLGANSVGTIMSAPYEVTLANVSGGQHVLSAIATDNRGAKNTNRIAITVNERPSISITYPAGGAVFTAPAGFTVGAAASDADGFVMSVEFLLGANSVGTIMSAPYEVTLANVSGGPHVLSAIATDNHGAKNTNRIVITVNERPSISITNPADGATFVAPAGFTIEAAASDADGFVTSVEFLLGANSVGTIMSAPYKVTLANVSGGPHVLSAIATDNHGAKNTNRIAITVNERPSISITNPANGAIFVAPAGFMVGAAASDADGFVTSVEFLLGVNSVGTIMNAPYKVTLANVSGGQHVLSTIATDNQGAKSTNQIAITVNERPSISITNPAAGAIFVAPAGFKVEAAASDADGSVTNVEFLLGASPVGTTVSAPYEVTLAHVSSGQHLISAIATDSQGAKSTNQIVVTVNERPSVSITNPADGATFVAPADFTIKATASDQDGAVTNVQFFCGITEIGVASALPLQASVTNLAPGNYVFSATVIDNLGACTTSAPISVVVRPLPTAQAFGTPLLAGGNFVFSFPTEPGALYMIEFSESLNPVNWQPLTNFPGDGSSLSFTNQIEGTREQRYFRLRIE